MTSWAEDQNSQVNRKQILSLAAGVLSNKLMVRAVHHRLGFSGRQRHLGGKQNRLNKPKQTGSASA